MQKKAAKLLAKFFIFMMVCVVLSKIFDSITIPKVSVVRASGNTLKFEKYGTGQIRSKKNHYIPMPEKIRVDEILVKAGENVEKGDTLVRLNQNSIKEALTASKREEKKMELQIAELLKSSTSEEGKAEDAKESLRLAKEEMALAIAEEKRANVIYDAALKKDKKSVLLNKNEEYDKEYGIYQKMLLEQNDAIKTAERNLQDAKAAVTAAKEKGGEGIRLLEQYMQVYGNNSTKEQETMDAFYVLLYGGKKGWETFRDEEKEIERKLLRARQDKVTADNNYENAEEGNLASFETARKEARRLVSDLEQELLIKRRKEERLREKLKEYADMRKENKETEAEQAKKDLMELLYGENESDQWKKENEESERKLFRAEEDYRDAVEKREFDVAAEEEKLEKMNQVLESIVNDTYDYEKAAKEEEQAVKAAEQTVREKEKAIILAKSAKNKEEKQNQSKEKSSQNQKEVQHLKQEALQLDLEALREKTKKIEELNQKKGRIRSPMNGTITGISLEEGKTTSGEENIAIGSSGFLLVGRLSKEDGDYVEIGDSMKIERKGKKVKLDGMIESIQFKEDEKEGQYTEIISELPEEEYINGTGVEFTIEKNSENYPVCIPIGALREGNDGNFVMVLRTKSGILGDELYAEKVGVTLIEKSSITAAIEGSITGEDEIVSESNKIVNPGDRVRKNVQ